MSRMHPIVAVTGASGSGRGSIRAFFDKLFQRQGITAAHVAGESFHRYTRAEMKGQAAKAQAEGRPFSHFSPEANLFDEQEALYRSYGESGTGRRRHYIHTAEDARRLGHEDRSPGEFTPWEDLPPNTDLLLYEGLHGVAKAGSIDLGRHVDLKIGVAPIVNLEWIQKIHNDTSVRGYSEEKVVEAILDRMHDYVHTVIPQFKGSDINFQHVPVVDTSDPIIARDVPTVDERVVVIRFRKPEMYSVDFPYLMSKIDRSWMSRRNTLVVPGAALELAAELVLTPIIGRLMDQRRTA
ncbi:MAG: phosphoribulokinase [Pseudomonadota bacterium]